MCPWIPHILQNQAKTFKSKLKTTPDRNNLLGLSHRDMKGGRKDKQVVGIERKAPGRIFKIIWNKLTRSDLLEINRSKKAKLDNLKTLQNEHEITEIRLVFHSSVFKNRIFNSMLTDGQYSALSSYVSSRQHKLWNVRILGAN